MTTLTPEIEDALAEWCGMPQVCATHVFHDFTSCSATPWRNPAPMPALLAQIAKEGWLWGIDNIFAWPKVQAMVCTSRAIDPDPEVALKLASYAALEAKR